VQISTILAGIFCVMMLMVTTDIVNAVPSATTPLIENGRASSVIILATDAAKDEELAARELQEYLQKIAGATVEIRRIPLVEATSTAQQLAGKQQVPILLGQAASAPALEKSIRVKSSDPGSFALLVEPNAVRVLGLSPEGTLFSTYELLEQIGVRWFMPGELGTVIPQAKTVSLVRQQTVQAPSFAGRWHGGKRFPEWARHVRMGGKHIPPAHLRLIQSGLR
jgi:hypothetical protein